MVSLEFILSVAEGNQMSGTWSRGFTLYGRAAMLKS